MLGCELPKGLNVLDLGQNTEILEEQVLHEILYRERPELKNRWRDIKLRVLDAHKAVEASEVLWAKSVGGRSSGGFQGWDWV